MAKVLRTRLSKTGQPVLGTVIDVKTDEGYERATVFMKGIGKDGRTLVTVGLEWADGTRQPAMWDGLEWKAVS